MKSPVKMTVRIALGAIMCVLSAMPLRAQTSVAVLPNGSQIIAIVNGTIMDKQPGVTSMGFGGATLYDASGKIVVERSSVIYFRDPLQTKQSWWGNEVRATSKGNHSIVNNRGVYSEQKSSPFVLGDGKYTTGGGNLLVRLGPELTGTAAGEVRFQALDVMGILCDLSNSSGSTSLRGGREGFSGGLQWVPPALSTGTPQTYSADLVVELRYGIDGYVDGGQNVALSASRVLDLEILGNDGITAVNIRKIAGNPAPPMLSGWTEIDGNTAFLTTSSKATGLRTSEQISWGNGNVAFPPGVPFSTWNWTTPKIVRVPLRLSSLGSTSFKITAVSSNASSAHRIKSLGKTSIPAYPAPATHPRLGNGIDVRVRLDRVTLLPGSGGGGNVPK